MEIVRRKLERLEVVRSVRVWNCDADPALKLRVRQYVTGRQSALGAIMAEFPPDKTARKPG